MKKDVDEMTESEAKDALKKLQEKQGETPAEDHDYQDMDDAEKHEWVSPGDVQEGLDEEEAAALKKGVEEAKDLSRGGAKSARASAGPRRLPARPVSFAALQARARAGIRSAGGPAFTPASFLADHDRCWAGTSPAAIAVDMAAQPAPAPAIAPPVVMPTLLS